MKTPLLIVVLSVILSLSAKGQMAVVDATANKQLMKSAMESAKQTQQLQQSLELMNEQKDRLEKVSGGLKKLQLLEGIIQNHSHLIKRIGKDIDALLSNPHLKQDESKIIQKNYSRMLSEISSDMAFIQDVIRDGVFKMDDGTRLNLLLQQKEEVEDKAMEADFLYQQYNKVLKYRAFKHKAENVKKGN